MSAPRTVLITGASSGFGKLSVPLLLERGHSVLAGIRGGEARLREIFALELTRFPGKLHAVDLHMDQPETFERAVRLIDEKFHGKLDVLINNAGLGVFGAVEDQDDSQLRHEFEVNFFGPVTLIRRLLGQIRAARGRILNVSSIAGRYTFPFYGSYSASKFALEAISEGLHYELKPFGIQVGLIEPGGFKTQFNQAKQVSAKSLSPESLYFERTRNFEHFLTTSSRRLGNPMDVARLLVRLCEKRRIPLRSVVGRDARALWVLGWILPDGVRLRFKDFVFRHWIFRA